MPPVDDRIKNDSLDPATARHAGECEFVNERDPAVLMVLLKVKPGMGDDRFRTMPRASGDDVDDTVGGRPETEGAIV